jgi:catechol 2,3-dioxygenase-like lactoylglutathione lyase family enzyme
MKIRLEHANLAVQDVDRMIRFVCTAFPEFAVRAEGKNWSGLRWVHVGTQDTYLALNEAPDDPSAPRSPYARTPGLNHLGYEVDDADGLRRRMLAAGYRDSTVPNEHPHRKRVYFYDPEGNDWEFVEYLSEAAEQRNDYAIPDVT